MLELERLSRVLGEEDRVEVEVEVKMRVKKIIVGGGEGERAAGRRKRGDDFDE